MTDIEIHGGQYRLAKSGGGSAIHLIRIADYAADGRSVTLCGRHAGRPARPSAGPTCQRCLASLDRLFPEPPPDDRIPIIIGLVIEALSAHGYAEILGVPGDQLKALRRAIRQEVRSRLGYASRTWLFDDRLVVDCEEAYAPHAEAQLKQAFQELGATFSGETVAPADDTGWRFHWATWSLP